MRVVGLLVAVAATAVTTWVIVPMVGPAPSGTQPWGTELADNFTLARAIPLTLGLGVLWGIVGGLASRGRARGAKRFSPAAIALHWILALGFLIALPTGVWQYMGGILDVQGPWPTYLYYRWHYVGAGIILTCVAAVVTYWWITGDRTLVIPRGEWRRHLRGFAQELPRPIGGRLARWLKLDLSQPAGSSGTFSFYEKVFEFPTWTFAIALITVTGIVKAIRYVVPIPGPILFVDSTLHVAAMVLILIKTLDHLRYTLGHWSVMPSMLSGAQPPPGATTGGDE